MDQPKKNSGASGRKKRHQINQGSSSTRSCQLNVNIQISNTCRVLRNTSRNQTNVNSNLIMVPLILITYSSAQLHKIINVQSKCKNLPGILINLRVRFKGRLRFFKLKDKIFFNHKYKEFEIQL